MIALGIDYGGSSTKLVLRDGDDEVARTRLATGSVERLADEVLRFLDAAPAHPSAFGVTIAGTLDAGSGVVGRSANLPWLDGTAPAATLSERLAVPGVPVRDGEAAAIAEAAAHTARDAFVVVLGTGIAGALVVDGRVRRGAHGAASEIGHMRVTDEALACSCGATGCLETVVGGTQLGVRWQELAASAPVDATARDVVAAAERGDDAARTVLDRAATGLARALLHVSALVDPELVILGGGVARSPRWTVEPAIARAHAERSFHTLPRFTAARLGDWAGAHGAAIAASREHVGSMR